MTARRAEPAGHDPTGQRRRPGESLSSPATRLPGVADPGAILAGSMSGSSRWRERWASCPGRGMAIPASECGHAREAVSSRRGEVEVVRELDPGSMASIVIQSCGSVGRPSHRRDGPEPHIPTFVDPARSGSRPAEFPAVSPSLITTSLARFNGDPRRIYRTSHDPSGLAA